MRGIDGWAKLMLEGFDERLPRALHTALIVSPQSVASHLLVYRARSWACLAFGPYACGSSSRTPNRIIAV